MFHLGNHSQTISEAVGIYTSYLASDAPYQIHVSPRIRDKVKLAIDEVVSACQITKRPFPPIALQPRESMTLPHLDTQASLPSSQSNLSTISSTTSGSTSFVDRPSFLGKPTGRGSTFTSPPHKGLAQQSLKNIPVVRTSPLPKATGFTTRPRSDSEEIVTPRADAFPWSRSDVAQPPLPRESLSSLSSTGSTVGPVVTFTGSGSGSGSGSGNESLEFERYPSTTSSISPIGEHKPQWKITVSESSPALGTQEKEKEIVLGASPKHDVPIDKPSQGSPVQPVDQGRARSSSEIYTGYGRSKAEPTARGLEEGRRVGSILPIFPIKEEAYTHTPSQQRAEPDAAAASTFKSPSRSPQRTWRSASIDSPYTSPRAVKLSIEGPELVPEDGYSGVRHRLHKRSAESRTAPPSSLRQGSPSPSPSSSPSPSPLPDLPAPPSSSTVNQSGDTILSHTAYDLDLEAEAPMGVAPPPLQGTYEDSRLESVPSFHTESSNVSGGTTSSLSDQSHPPLGSTSFTHSDSMTARDMLRTSTAASTTVVESLSSDASSEGKPWGLSSEPSSLGDMSSEGRPSTAPSTTQATQLIPTSALSGIADDQEGKSTHHSPRPSSSQPTLEPSSPVPKRAPRTSAVEGGLSREALNREVNHYCPHLHKALRDVFSPITCPPEEGLCLECTLLQRRAQHQQSTYPSSPCRVSIGLLPDPENRSSSLASPDPVRVDIYVNPSNTETLPSLPREIETKEEGPRHLTGNVNIPTAPSSSPPPPSSEPPPPSPPAIVDEDVRGEEELSCPHVKSGQRAACLVADGDHRPRRLLRECCPGPQAGEREEIKAEADLTEFLACVFDEALDRVLRWMEKSSYKKFLQSREWKMFVNRDLFAVASGLEP